jgi:hypothetical protein
VRSVGLGGVFLTTPDPLPVGGTLTLLFQVPGGEVRARAIVRSSAVGEGMGVQFTGMGPDERARLQRWLKQLLE